MMSSLKVAKSASDHVQCLGGGLLKSGGREHGAMERKAGRQVNQ